MAYKSLRMDKIKQVLDYHQQGVAIKKIARLLGVSKNTVKKYIKEYKSEEFLGQISLETLQEHFSGSPSLRERWKDRDISDRLAGIMKELGRVGVTRYLLWEEYIGEVEDGYSYSRFCKKIAAYKAQQDVTLRIEHKAARVLSIDFTGKKAPWVDKPTGEQHWAEVLVFTMPFSAYTFAYALPSQKQEDFIEGINQALIYIGGLPQVLQSDNLKSFVTKSDRYAPTFNELCLQLSSYYGIDLDATRVAKPKDKASVERHVSIVYNKLFAPLRNEVFHSIDQINEAFLPLIDKLNTTTLQGKDYSRKDRFDQDEGPHLRPLPSALFELTKSTKAKVQRNYHVFLGEDNHFYSVPYKYVGKSAIIRYTSKTVEVYIAHCRIGLYQRDRRRHGYSSLVEHMPDKHKKWLETKGWDEDYFKSQAFQIGPFTLWAISEILKSKQFVEQSYNACLGIFSLNKKYTSLRLENACRKAYSTHRINLGIIRNILQNNMDSAPQAAPDPSFKIPQHDNIRGANNYH